MNRKRISILVAVVALIGATLGCTLSSGPLSSTTRPALIPTATVAAPQVASAALQATPASLAPANELEAQVEAVYEQAGPAVVNITSRIVTYDFFMQPVPQEGTGSGFIYDAEGHIVTNYHVVENAESVSVALSNGAVYPAEIVGSDPSNDLAVLHIEAENLPTPIPLGDSDQLRVGQFVVAIGNPVGLEGTLTTGVISSLGRVIQSPDGRFIGEAIQTDAAINPGNSGGPLLNLYGQVIGVNSQIISPDRASAGIGFAISSNTVRRVVPTLITQGHYPHPSLGVSVAELTPNRVQALQKAGVDISVEEGLLVIEVTPGGPAAQAGIRGADRVVEIHNTRVPVGGDVITALNGTPIATMQDLTIYLESETRVGDTVQVTFVRDGQEQTVAVTLTERAD